MRTFICQKQINEVYKRDELHRCVCDVVKRLSEIHLQCKDVFSVEVS